jgi:hypothetical protein
VGVAALSGGRSLHLVRRFVGSLRPGGPSRADSAWACSHLLDGEVTLWNRLPGADRRHAVGVGRRVVELLGGEADRPVVAAALLHDVGKVVSGLGTYGRVVATLSAGAAGHATAAAWSEAGGFTRRVGLYLRHPELGGDLLELAGSDPFTIAWTREHHLPPERWTVDPDLGRVLKAADDD